MPPWSLGCGQSESGHRHLNGELDPPAHGQLQEELSEPQLGKVTALLQCFTEIYQVSVEE